MADDKRTERAKALFSKLCGFFDENSWRYECDDEALRLNCKLHGDDIPMDIDVIIDADRELVILLSNLPFTMPEDRRLDGAIAVSVTNNALVDGCFDYDITDGHLFFRMTCSYIGSELGREVLEYMLACACMTIDEYNDKLLMLAKGVTPISTYIAGMLTE